MNKIKEENGQSVMEFLLGFSIVFTMVMLLLRVAMQYTNGYFLHYATFMASRTYMVVDVNGDETQNDQIGANRAKEVFNKFNVGALIPKFTSTPVFQSPDFGGNTVFSGVYAEFTDKFSPIKMMGGSSDITYRSESFLRREPGRSTCLEQTCKSMQELGVSCSKHVTLYDNGC